MRTHYCGLVDEASVDREVSLAAGQIPGAIMVA
jgi:hypothetical protein